MNTFIIVLLFLLGLILIIKGGDIFVDSASWIAEKSGMPKFLIGATIVSFVTTLPELVASIIGTLEGSLGLAVGNAVGSVTANTGMIMAISVIFMPVVVDRKQIAFKSILLMITSLVLGIFLLNGKLQLWEAIVVILFAVAFMWENISVAKSLALTQTNKEEDVSGNSNKDINNNINTIDAFKYILSIGENNKRFNKNKELIFNILKFALGGVGIYFGARLLVDEGTALAQILNISEDIIGLTLVAIGTSLPELVTTLTAIAKKQSSLSVGNIVGANIIDMSVILPICAFISGGTLVLDSMQTAYIDIPVSLVVMLIAFVPTLINKKFSRIQGILMLAIYIAYLVVICCGVLPW